MKRVLGWGLSVLVLIGIAPELFAATGGGGHSIGANLIYATTSQDDINTLISRANQREGGISTSQLNNAYELGLQYGYRFSGTVFAFQLRPSFFYQSEGGTGTNGSFDYSVMGYTVFPLFRLYPLENQYIKFFMQLGMGYGSLTGQIEEATAKVKFRGSAFGSIFGLGAEFCFTPNHCLVTEGNMRYLPIDRNIAKEAKGTFTSGSLSQVAVDKEVEFDQADLRTSMSGLQFALGYSFYF